MEHTTAAFGDSSGYEDKIEFDARQLRAEISWTERVVSCGASADTRDRAKVELEQEKAALQGLELALGVIRQETRRRYLLYWKAGSLALLSFAIGAGIGHFGGIAFVLGKLHALL
jgi:hypothetical protein